MCPNIPVYGDMTWRGECPPEQIEQASFFSKLRRECPDTYGIIAVHPRNEGLVVKGQFQSVTKHRIEGMAKGAADIIIPGARSFVIELKRRDHTKSKWQDGQREYLAAAAMAGAFTGVALGAAAAWAAFEEWTGQGVQPRAPGE